MGRTTTAWSRFMSALVAMESNTENSGTYTYKPGYHASRADNIAMDKTDNTTVVDYSIRDAVDKLGPSDASAAGDWTHRSAQAGNYSSMDKYGERLESAFNRKDPRLNGWREALGQTDMDASPEGLDFRYWTRRVPDDTHSWHWHFSESRAYAESWENKLAMLSVLKGETLEQFLANGGVLLYKDGSGIIPREEEEEMVGNFYTIALGGPGYDGKIWYLPPGNGRLHVPDIATLSAMRAALGPSATTISVPSLAVLDLVAPLPASDAVALASIKSDIAELQKLVVALQVGQVPVDVDQIVRDAVRIELNATRLTNG
jgi:hypothetical protein